MNNIIWNAKELKNIKQIILKRANLNVNNNNELELITQDYLSNNIYQNFHEELTNLFYFQDREKIREILTKASLVNADKDNKLHHGFIINLSKINPDNYEEIFQIYKDLIAHYEHITAIIAEKMLSNIESEEVLREKIEYLKNATETTTEEKLVINHLNKTFIFANGICDEELLQPLINKLNSLIKIRLIYKYNMILTREIKNENKKRKKDYNEMKKANQNKYLKNQRYKNRSYGIHISK